MLSQIKITFENIIEKGYNENPWTNVYGLARSFIALGLLITLVFTGANNLFPTLDGVPLKQPILDIEKISIFYLFQNNIKLAWFLSILVLTAVISGILPRITGILHWWITFSYMVSGMLIEGGDQIASILALFLIPITVTDNRINHWHKRIESNRPKTKLFIWSVYCIIVFQVSVVYFHAGVAKLGVNEWLNGTAVYYWFTHSIFGLSGDLNRIVGHVLAKQYIVVLITWGVMVFEILLFGWLFMKRNKWNWKLLFVTAVIFHLSMAFVHGLVSFMFTMIGALVLYILPKNINLNLKAWKSSIWY